MTTCISNSISSYRHRVASLLASFSLTGHSRHPPAKELGLILLSAIIQASLPTSSRAKQPPRLLAASRPFALEQIAAPRPWAMRKECILSHSKTHHTSWAKTPQNHS
ncbi:hypothetical protein Nepgr_018813 [Nepenthes gracilis]|uniref:Uncharacterized protein n=1 Tax=Nepenthes gracilis TaxID=150966 RepID=A0AAD3STR6_NEPGR|nr:hypothetical protein Nepgr_018813 [Nepenthes gracilis]